MYLKQMLRLFLNATFVYSFFFQYNRDGECLLRGTK